MNIFLILISSSAFNVTIYVEVFTTPFEWGNSNFPRLCRSYVILTLFTCYANGEMSNKGLNVMQTD